MVNPAFGPLIMFFLVWLTGYCQNGFWHRASPLPRSWRMVMMVMRMRMRMMMVMRMKMRMMMVMITCSEILEKDLRMEGK